MAKETILIVEDDRIVAEGIKISLERFGYTVQAIAASGEKALGIIKENPPDLVLMDILLEGPGDGIETAGQILDRYDIPVVYLTAYDSQDLLDRAKKTRPMGYIIKPFEERELNVAVEMGIYKHRMEKELRQNREWLDLTLNSIGDAVIATDQKGRIEFMNVVAQSKTGWPEEEAIGKPIQDIFHVIDKKTGKPIENPLERMTTGGIGTDVSSYFVLAQNGKPFPVEAVLISKNKWRLDVEDSLAPLKDHRGNILGSVLVFQDVTQRKQAEAQLQQLQKLEAIGTLAGGIAHDFNNILTSINGFAELALMDAETGSRMEEYLQEIFTAGTRAKGLVDQILTFASRTKDEVKPTRIDWIAMEALKLIRAAIPTTIDIEQHIKSRSSIMGNTTHIHQIFMNLCTNAAQAMESKGGLLQIEVKDVCIKPSSPSMPLGMQPGDYVEIKVSDTGVGIPPENIGSIFEPFFTTMETGEGTGMGLSIVHGIVESCNGKITVDSENGKGTVFTVYLPITPKREAVKVEKSYVLPSGSERILFLDDEAPIARLGGKILGQLGYTVSTRTSSIEALELFRSKPDEFDLVITDMTMPNMTGDVLAKQLMETRPDIPVILYTGYSKKISDRTAREIGIKAFAHKPIVKADLANTVRKVLDDAKGSRSD